MGKDDLSSVCTRLEQDDIFDCKVWNSYSHELRIFVKRTDVGYIVQGVNSKGDELFCKDIWDDDLE